MSRIFQAASAAAVGLTALTAVALTVPGLAQTTADYPAAIVYHSEPVIGTTAPADRPTEPLDSAPVAEAPTSIPVDASSLAAMVAAADHQEPADEQLRCLAAGIYFESKGESLSGQLAVAHVIINRANSGRFANSHCGVLTQRGQFSFVRGGVVPRATNMGQWRTAVAIARIAMADSWANPVPGAMFFHAARVSPGWNRPRVARLGNHIFYR